MSFWGLGRRRKEPEPSPAAPPKPVTERLSVVEFWSADQRVTVGMDLSQGRLTDLVNRDQSVRVVVLDAPPEDPSQGVDKQPGQAWVDFEAEETLLIFPPPQLTDPRRRLHRPKQPIEIVIGPFEVSGAVHIPPGAQAAGFLFRLSTRFTPITRVSVRDTRLAGFEQRAEVVLVNLRQVGIIRDVGLGESEEAEAAEASHAPEAADGADAPIAPEVPEESEVPELRVPDY